MSTQLRTQSLLLSALLVFAMSCGGSAKKNADEPAESEQESVVEPADDAGDDGMFPPEKFDQIKRFFDRKREPMARCFTEAIKLGEINKRASGRATVMMIIDTRGRPTEVRITQMQPKSTYLEKCIIENVEKWTITDLPKPLDYSYTFGFGT